MILILFIVVFPKRKAAFQGGCHTNLIMFLLCGKNVPLSITCINKRLSAIFTNVFFHHTRRSVKPLSPSSISRGTHPRGNLPPL
ncbi:MAG: hypothetical protein IJY17_09335, partial [Alphaproteobacteria bacterium]|nr:hypothetical protein [Alphaproteobacteria bacterium]